VKSPRLVLSEAAIADILEQADWYESQADPKLARRWEKSVTSALLRISGRPSAGKLCTFSADELKGTRRSPVAGFPKHLISTGCTKKRFSFCEWFMARGIWRVFLALVQVSAAEEVAVAGLSFPPISSFPASDYTGTFGFAPISVKGNPQGAVRATTAGAGVPAHG
jgi:plasmid stabilization system protein ParE